LVQRVKQEREVQQRGWIGAAILIVLVVGLIWLGQSASRHFGTVETFMADLGAWAPLLFILCYVLLVPFCFPVSVLGFSAGALFGVFWGTLLLTLGAVLAASLVFPLARRFFRVRILAYAESRRRLVTFIRLADQDAPRLQILIRLSPLNFGLANYLLSVSRVSYRIYLLGTLCVVPSALAQAYLGYAAGRLGRMAGGTATGTPLETILTVFGLVVCVVLLFIIGRLARQALRSAAANDDSMQGNQHDDTVS